jgi:hypothetical protein
VGLINQIIKLWYSLVTFFNPVILIATSITGIVTFLIGAFENPSGWLSQVIKKLIDIVAAVLPETPDNLKVTNLLQSLYPETPSVGKYVLGEIVEVLITLSAIALVIKIYKLIPFKAT